jgi:DNA recombination protein RmuC
VIIDSKVSLNAFTRLIEAVDVDIQKLEIKAHISAVKSHIVALSTKGYDDYNRSLDFVMLFVPSEPAYIAALQHDPELWNFAYDKRILLLSPTNLITSLKLIVDLWKREYQNQNAVAIAKRGELLYSKFVGFVDSITTIGSGLKTAQESYNKAFSQLSTGSGNLINQASELISLGVTTKKPLSNSLVRNALVGNEIV